MQQQQRQKTTIRRMRTTAPATNVPIAPGNVRLATIPEEKWVCVKVTIVLVGKVFVLTGPQVSGGSWW